jgi:hypothetical protein
MMYKKFEPVYPYFSIIGGSNQILQVGMLYGKSFYIASCEVVYGSEWLSNEARELKLLGILSLRTPTRLTRLTNTKEQIEYIGLRRGKGKILVLDVS